MKPVIDVSHISKMYRRGQLGTNSFKQDLKYWWQKHVLGQPNVFFQDGGSDYFWALDDISFQVNEGEILGIVGRNGSGKSTLLKIISRITSPTRGRVRGRGQISSMLEVGTGFSPELTGRQNIYLSGALLGMSRLEIDQRFDEIVHFSEVEEFIDTPVKRYSSGMYVRLAFAVASHLEADIMIIDEVLAVGDAAFQQKCLQKMHQITKGNGRTALFVTHNMPSVRQFCHQAIWLQDGHLQAYGTPDDIVKSYMLSLGYLSSAHTWADPQQAPGNEWVRMRSVGIHPQGNGNLYSSGDEAALQGSICTYFSPGEKIKIKFSIITQDGIALIDTWTDAQAAGAEMDFGLRLPLHLLAPISYSVSVAVYLENSLTPMAEFPHLISFGLQDTGLPAMGDSLIRTPVACWLNATKTP